MSENYRTDARNEPTDVDPSESPRTAEGEYVDERRAAEDRVADDRQAGGGEFVDRPAADPAVDQRTDPAGATAAGGERRIDRDPSSERMPPEADAGPTSGSAQEGLLTADDRGAYQRRWDDIQVRFIDEPRQSAREADDLVGEVTQRIADRFSSDRQDLERRWESGDEPTTEELRQAVQRYRDFFQRLVAQ